MSLPNAPFGFRPIRSLSGGNLRVGEYIVASTANRIYKGDVVSLLNSTGTIARWAASTVERVIGVAAEQFNNSGTAAVKIRVYDAHDTVFEVQGNNATAVTQVKIGNPFRLVATAGDTTLGYSKETVNITTATAASASNIVFVQRLSPKLDNDLSAYSVFEVVLAGDPAKIARA